MTMKNCEEDDGEEGEEDEDDDDEGEGLPDLLEPAEREDCEKDAPHIEHDKLQDDELQDCGQIIHLNSTVQVDRTVLTPSDS